MSRNSMLGPVSIVASLIMALSPGAHAAQGVLDPTFGQEGRVVTDIAIPGAPGYFPTTTSVLIQPDGKVLVCGHFLDDGFGAYFGTFIVRYLPNGAVDPSFGEQGVVIGSGFGSPMSGEDMALQPDGSLVQIGAPIFGGEGIPVWRYLATGQLDRTFGNNGLAVVPNPVFLRAMAGLSIAVQPDGRIVGLGWEVEPYAEPYYDAIVLFRMEADGTLDETFGPDGTGIVRIRDGYGVGTVLLQPDGRILVAGVLINFAPYQPTPLLARFNPDGSLDSRFGNSGMVTERIHGLDSAYDTAVLQPDGKIVAMGRTLTPFGSFAARYNSDGSPDTGFGVNGVLSVASSYFESPRSVVLDPARRIVALGHARDEASGDTAIALLRLTHDGALDPTFGAGGRSVLPIREDGVARLALASDMAMRRDGRVLVTGAFPDDDTTVLLRVSAGPRFGRPRGGGVSPRSAPEPRVTGVTTGPVLQQVRPPR